MSQKRKSKQKNFSSNQNKNLYYYANVDDLKVIACVIFRRSSILLWLWLRLVRLLNPSIIKITTEVLWFKHRVAVTYFGALFLSKNLDLVYYNATFHTYGKVLSSGPHSQQCQQISYNIVAINFVQNVLSQLKK